MPVEYTKLQYRVVPLSKCPKCGEQPFEPFLRGMVHSWWRRFLRLEYCCLICSSCKEIVGYEKP